LQTIENQSVSVSLSNAHCPIPVVIPGREIGKNTTVKVCDIMSSGRPAYRQAGRPDTQGLSNNSVELLRKQPVPTLVSGASHFFEVPFSYVLSFLPAGKKVHKR